MKGEWEEERGGKGCEKGIAGWWEGGKEEEKRKGYEKGYEKGKGKVGGRRKRRRRRNGCEREEKSGKE